MLKQSHVWASRASSAQKLQGLRVVNSKHFSRATFFVFWGTHLVDRFLSYLPVNKFGEKVQCGDRATEIQNLRKAADANIF